MAVCEVDDCMPVEEARGSGVPRGEGGRDLVLVVAKHPEGALFGDYQRLVQSSDGAPSDGLVEARYCVQQTWVCTGMVLEVHCAFYPTFPLPSPPLPPLISSL